MKFDPKSADTSFYYRSGTAVDIARVDSSAVSGNLADAMKNSVLVLNSLRPVEPLKASPQTQLKPNPQ